MISSKSTMKYIELIEPLYNDRLVEWKERYLERNFHPMLYHVEYSREVDERLL